MMSVLTSSVSPATIFFLVPPLLIILTLLTTFVFTTLRYHVSHLTSSRDALKPQPPAFLPYYLPFLGHALSFLQPRPGAFWTDLLTRRVSRSTGATTLLLGGQTMHVLFSSVAVQALFKSKNITRHPFNVQVVTKGFGASQEDCDKIYASKTGEKGKSDNARSADVDQEELNFHYLLTQSAVNELTTSFIQVLRDELGQELAQWKELNLYGWLKQHMFQASTVALCGSRIFESCPNLAEDFFVFDAEMLNMFFGLPKFIAPAGFNARDRLLDNLSKWVTKGWEEYRHDGRDGPQPESTAWDPIFGARVVQARELLMEKIDISMRGRASLHLGFLFGLSSNAIPSTGWMLMHILSPDADSTLLPRVLAEVRSARLDDGTPDVSRLISLPLLQSIFQETLRMYVDVLVTREVIDSDLVLPIDAAGQKKILLKKNTIVMAPSWLGHRDADAWGEDPPFDVFFPERFLRIDEKTGNEVFSTEGTAGKLFPWGGGRSVCPGRVFAKQEVLATVAMVLTTFEIETQGYVDEAGKETTKFPGLKKGFVGNGIMAASGDLRVKIRRKK